MAAGNNILEKIHKVNDMLLDELKRICDENNITYFLDSGVLLGAIRHQDFIPWDDDVDIAFLRKDYEKFLEVAPMCLGENFKLVMPGEICGEAFFDFIPKIVYIPSKTHPDNEEEMFLGNRLNHIYMDLIVIDKAPLNRLKKLIQIGFLFIIYGLAMGHRYQINYTKYKFHLRPFVFILQLFGKKIPIKKLVKWYNKVSSIYNQHNASEVFRSNGTLPYLNRFYKFTWYSEISEGKIHSKNYSIPKGSKKILEILYGNYMELPPIEDRVCMHVEEEFVRIS